MNKNTISKWFSMFVLMMVAGITGATAQSLTVADFSIEQGATKEIAISVAAADGQAIYGIQTDITLSEGLTLTNAAAFDNSLTLTKNTLKSGPTRVSLLSQEGATITAGDAIKLTVTAASDFIEGTITLTNSKLTTSTAGAEINVENSTANVTKAEPVVPVIPEGISYSWESPAGKPIEWGGTIAYVNGDGDRLNYKNGDYYTICLNGKKANLNDETASADAGKMVITLDKAVAEGDTIAYTAYINKDASKKASPYILFENGTAVEGEAFSDEANINAGFNGVPTLKYSVIPAEAAGSKTITLTRSQTGTNLFITKLQIIEKKAEVDPLVAAKEALQTAIAIASNINPEGLADAITAAQTALGAEDATATSLASAAQTLEGAIKNYFNEVLPRLGAIVGGLNDSTLNAAYANAQAALAKEDVTPQELAAAMQQIITTAQAVAPEHLQNLKGYAVKYGAADAVSLVDNALAAITSGNVSQIIATMAAVNQAATPLAQQVLDGIIGYVEAFGLTEQAAQAQAALESGNYVTMITVAKAIYTHLIAAAKNYLPGLAVITEGLNDSTLNAAYANAQAVLANENVTPEDLGTAMQQIIVAAKAVAPAHLQNLRGYAVKYGQEGTAALVDSALVAINAGNVSKIIATMTAVREAATPLATGILQQMIGYAQSYNGFEADVTEAQTALRGGNYITMITTAKALYAKLIAAANDYVASAKAIPTEGKEGVDALNTAISAAEQALAAQDSDFSAINTAISNLVAAVKAFEEANLVTIDPTVIKPTTVIDAEFTNIADLAGQNFAIINKAEEKALYGSTAQNLAYDSYANAFSSSNSGYLWKLVSLADDADADVHNYYRFQLITPTGADYNCWGMGGWLNSQPVSGSVSFILGLNNQNGQDIKNGAVYDVQYVEGQGFTIKNIATGLYQGANNGAAKNEEPTYFTFATVSNTYVPALEALLAEGAEYKALVTDEAALAAYDTAIAGIDPTAITGNGLTECQTVDAAITALAKAVPATVGQDYTRAIVNPSFELGNTNGWTSNDGGNTANNGNFGAATGSFFVEKWTAAPNKLSDGSFLQVIKGLPYGKYKLTAELQNREQGNDDAAGKGLFLVANEGKTECVAKDGTTFEVVGTTKRGGVLEIGIKLEGCTGNWICFDNFQLTFVEAVAAPAETTATFDFADSNFREKIGTAMADVDGFIYNETFTAGGASLQVTAGSAPSRVYVDNNRGQNLVTYKEYTTLTFKAPEGKAIVQIDFTAAGNSNINNFTASSGAIEGMVWTGNADGVRFAQGGTSYLANAILTLVDKTAETAALPAIEYTECANIAAFNALAAGTYAKITLTNAEVIGKSADGYSTVWMQDATGGCWIQYTSLNDKLTEKTKVNGTIYTIKRETSGNPQMKEAEATLQSELNATAIESYTAIVGTIAEVNVAANLNKVVKIAADSLVMTSASAGKLYVGETSIDVTNGTATGNQQLCKIADWEKDKVLKNITIEAILVAKSATVNQLLPISIAAPELAQTLNVERYAGLGYTAQEATVDFTVAKAFLGVDAITTDMLSIVNPDNTTISNYGEFDGWFNGEGVAETWGSNTKVCVKFFEAIANDGKYSICDMNGADEVGKTYSVKWQLEANGKKVIYTINVTFVAAPEYKPEIVKTIDVPVYMTAETAYEALTAQFDATEVATALNIASIADAKAYIVNVTTGNFVENATDGWRDANGDAAQWTDATNGLCAKIQDPASGTIDYLGAHDANFVENATYTAKWGFVANEKAVVLNINITFKSADFMTRINSLKSDSQLDTIYNMNGQKVNKAQRGLYIINGKKVVVK